MPANEKLKQALMKACDEYELPRISKGSLSIRRKNDVDNIRTIIGSAASTYDLYIETVQRLEAIRTGWWIFQTGRSELKRRCLESMTQSKLRDYLLEDSRDLVHARVRPLPIIQDTISNQSLLNEVAQLRSLNQTLQNENQRLTEENLLLVEDIKMLRLQNETLNSLAEEREKDQEQVFMMDLESLKNHLDQPFAASHSI